MKINFRCRPVVSAIGILFMVGGIVGAGSALAADKKIEYKCYFEMVGGEKLVQHIVSPLGNARLLHGQMQGKTLFAKDGVTKKYIYRVFECVKATKSFKSADAQTIDARTLS